MTTKHILLKILEKLFSKKYKEFINKDTQDAVVYSVKTTPTFDNDSITNVIYVKCYTPFWGDLPNIHLVPAFEYDEIQRGDIVTLRRIGTAIPGVYTYDVVKNRTEEKVKKKVKRPISMFVQYLLTPREPQH